MRQVEVIVLGAGPAGYACAIRLAQLGKKVLIIDEAELGGVCLNRGCIPSKALIHAGSFYERMSQVQTMGIEVDGLKMHLNRLMEWKDSVVKKLTQGIHHLFHANGCELLKGRARFLSSHTLEVDVIEEKQVIDFQVCIIATGSRPMELSGFEVDQVRILDSTGALNLNQIPRSLLCIGGGYIGLELGTFYAKIGTKVKIVENGSVILREMDSELRETVLNRLQQLGIEVCFNQTLKGSQKMIEGVQVCLESNGVETKQVYEKVLVSIGRKPNSDQLGLKEIGVQMDEKGFILVNRQQQTSIPHLYAIGDITGPPLLAHKASKEAMVAAEVIAGKKMRYEVIGMPIVIFTDPEIATVGFTEKQAKDQGYQVQVSKVPYTINGRALGMGESQGWIKIVSDQSSHLLLGVQIAGAQASHLISEGTLALEMGAQLEDLALTLRPHPTLSEIFMEAAQVNLGSSIHFYQRKSEK